VPLELTVRIVVFDPPAVTERLVRLKDQASPDGDADPVILTVPAKPLWLTVVIVDVNVELAVIVLEPGVANIVKKGTWIVTVFVWLVTPLVPVTLSR
jgi:hypothetical protein